MAFIFLKKVKGRSHATQLLLIFVENGHCLLYFIILLAIQLD